MIDAPIAGDAGRPLPSPLLGEWACLGVLYDHPAHGWAIATRLRPDGDVGRVWHLSRPLTYRSLDQLTRRGWVRPVGEEPGDAGPNRTILAITRAGRARFRSWVRTPVEHVRDLRSELLLKLVFAEQLGIDVGPMLDRQREVVERHVRALDSHPDDPDARGEPDDVVRLWRQEVTRSAQRFIDRVRRSRAAADD
jgi:DNA-binding PadR family transcriptional regulator